MQGRIGTILSCVNLFQLFQPGKVLPRMTKSGSVSLARLSTVVTKCTTFFTISQPCVLMYMSAVSDILAWKGLAQDGQVRVSEPGGTEYG